MTITAEGRTLRCLDKSQRNYNKQTLQWGNSVVYYGHCIKLLGKVSIERSRRQEEAGRRQKELCGIL